MRGFDVLAPDGLGRLRPARRAARDQDRHAPARDHRRRTSRPSGASSKSLGFSYDWAREIDTTDPSYVRWTQWIFLKLFENGLAFQSEIPVNWCQELGTVLANEEVIDGRASAAAIPVIRKPLRQWLLRITAYADRLAERSRGPRLARDAARSSATGSAAAKAPRSTFRVDGRTEKLTVFTTRPDTLFGATYVVLAPDHPLTRTLASPEQPPRSSATLHATARKSDLERTGRQGKNRRVHRRFRRSTPQRRQSSRSTSPTTCSAPTAPARSWPCPAHDERDFEFATAFRLPIMQVVSADGKLRDGSTEPFTGDGIAVQLGAVRRSDDGRVQAEDQRAPRGQGRWSSAR